MMFADGPERWRTEVTVKALGWALQLPGGWVGLEVQAPLVLGT